MSGSINSSSGINFYAWASPPGGFSGGDGVGGAGGSKPDTYDSWNNGPPAGSSGTASRPGVGASQPPSAISDPKTGRETSDAPIEFLTWDGYHGATGTAQQILDQLPALTKYNDARAKSVSLISGGTPALRLPGGYVVQFSDSSALAQYLTRSAQPVVPTAQVAATFQGVLGRAPTEQDVSQAESAFNAGKSLADYRASLVNSEETRGTLRGISLQVLGRDASPAELDGYKAQLAAGTSMGDLRAGLAQSAEAAADVRGLSQSVLGRAAAEAEVARMQVRLTTGGTLADVRGDLAGSQEAGNAVIQVFGAELGRAPDASNVTDMQRALGAPGGSLDGVRAYLAGTTEAQNAVTAAFQATLGRAPAADNVAGMQHMLAEPGGSLDGVRKFLSGTTEAAGKLSDVFQAVLGRAPDQNNTAWMRSLLEANNGSLDGVRGTIAQLPEASLQVAATGQQALGRGPTATELAAATAALADGASLNDLRAVFGAAANLIQNPVMLVGSNPSSVTPPAGAPVGPFGEGYVPLSQVPPNAQSILKYREIFYDRVTGEYKVGFSFPNNAEVLPTFNR